VLAAPYLETLARNVADLKLTTRLHTASDSWHTEESTGSMTPNTTKSAHTQVSPHCCTTACDTCLPATATGLCNSLCPCMCLCLCPLCVYAGRGRDANPLAHVLQAIGEPLECKQYNTWNVVVPEGQFLTRVRVQHSSCEQVMSKQPGISLQGLFTRTAVRRSDVLKRHSVHSCLHTDLHPHCCLQITLAAALHADWQRQLLRGAVKDPWPRCSC
jgi:hypothetical protein